jgi:hypothetical protein
MWRFPTLFAGMIALSLPSTGAFGNDVAPRHASPPSAPSVPTQGSSDWDASAHQAERNSAAYLQRQVSDLQDLAASVKQQLGQREARGSGPDAGGRQATVNSPEQEDANLQRQDNELHTELQGLIAQLEQELQLETKNPPAPEAEEQQQRQAALNALKYFIADLRQDDSRLQDLIAQHHQKIAPREAQTPPPPDIRGRQAESDAPEHQVAALQRQIADLRGQSNALRGQLAEQKQKLSQGAQELAQQTHDIDAARAEAERLGQDVDRLRRQHHQEDEASLGRQKGPAQQVVVTVPARPNAPKPPQPTQPMRQPPQSAPTPQSPQHVRAPQPLPAPSAAQELQTARQWLTAGRPEEARRVLAMVRTQMVFQPSTPPDRPDAEARYPSVEDVGEAIRSLDMGDGGRAVQSITRAIAETTNAPPETVKLVRAWSGYRPGTR